MGQTSAGILVFIGSYADAADPGLYVCVYDPETGRLERVDEVSGLQNPTFLTLDEQAMRLYAISEDKDAEGQRVGTAAAYTFAPSGKLTKLNEVRTVNASTCHITLDATRQCLIVASYHGGLVGLSPVLEDGRIGRIADVHQHEGSSIHPAQSQARAHSVFLDAANRYAVACDLGADKLFVYRLDADGKQLIPHGEMALEPGSGPRHFAFHPSGKYGYVINELGSTITAFSYDGSKGTLVERQTVSTLPDSFDGENGCADIHVSPDGRFVYGSNRGHDSIVVMAVGEDGLLSVVEHVSSGGGHPRNFALSPDGRFVLVANRDDNNVVTFKRDAVSGRLTPTGDELKVSKPVCVKLMSAEVGR